MIIQKSTESEYRTQDRSGKTASKFASSIYYDFDLNTSSDPNPSDGIWDGIGLDDLIPLHVRRIPPQAVRHLNWTKSIAADGFSIADTARILPGHEPLTSDRSFIGGVSHCYNNLLMGIWGYASLIGMDLEKSDPFQAWMTQLEEYIQSGSNLMHLLFGYIGERRSAARKLRLKQLKIELEAYHKICEPNEKLSEIDRCIVQLHNCRTRPQLAASIARVIDRMFSLLYQKRSLIDERSLQSPKAAAYLDKIDDLLLRGADLILKLQYYAGVRIPIKRTICLKSIVMRRIAAILIRKPNLDLTFRDSVNMPEIDADLHQVDFALDQLLRNAVQAVSEEEKIEVRLSTLYSESPQDRCGVHMLKDYAVITLVDTGKGMTTSFQSKIFEPFFTGIKGQGRAGLGLSAAAGIIRAHGGYIQVRSKTSMGSTFKIYLPL